jgi:hypothetical protein
VAVNRAVRLNFDVVANHRDSRLSHFFPFPVCFSREAEAVAADDHSVLQQDAVSDAAVLADARVRVSEEIVADFRAAIDRDEAVQYGVRADLDIFGNVAVRADVCAGSYFGGRSDHSGSMDAGCILRRGMKHFDRAREIEIRIRRAQRCDARPRFVRRNQDRRRARCLKRRAVLAIDEERQLARLRLPDSGDARDFKVFIALDGAAKFFGDLSQFHFILLTIR